MKFTFATFLLSFVLLSSSYPQLKVYGYVIDIQKAEPVENATVFVHDEYNIAFNPPVKTQTDENGYYEFTNLDYGTYSINAFVYYEADGDTFAFVYQPGELTLKKHERSDLLESEGYSFSFAFSEDYFKYRLELQKNPRKVFFNNTRKVFYSNPRNLAQSQIMSFLKPRIDTNARPHFNSRPSSFIEKKTW